MTQVLIPNAGHGKMSARGSWERDERKKLVTCKGTVDGRGIRRKSLSRTGREDSIKERVLLAYCILAS